MNLRLRLMLSHCPTFIHGMHVWELSSMEVSLPGLPSILCTLALPNHAYGAKAPSIHAAPECKMQINPIKGMRANLWGIVDQNHRSHARVLYWRHLNVINLALKCLLHTESSCVPLCTLPQTRSDPEFAHEHIEAPCVGNQALQAA